MRAWHLIGTGLVAAAVTLAQSGPTHHWRLDGPLADAVGTNHGTAVGLIGTNVDGAIASAGIFSNSYANVGLVLSTSAYTKAAWIYRYAGGGNNNLISGENTTSRHAFFCPVSLGYRLSSGHNGNWTSVQETAGIPSNTWTHVAVTYDRAVNGGTLMLYRNGQLVSGVPVATNIAPPGGGLCLLGGWDLNVVNGHWGRLDDVGLWDRALTGTEIANLYRAGAHNADVQAAAGFELVPAALVPEATNYAVIYDYDIPTASALGGAGLPNYTWNNAAAYTNALTYDRVAYYLELWTNQAVSARWVYVSMDAFTRNPARIGVPGVAAGGSFQQVVSNLNVFGGAGSVTTGTGLASGNIEFWGYNYSATNLAGIPNASSTLFDVGDSGPDLGGTYGCMQVHNHAAGGTTNRHTIFAYNRFGYGGTSDLGIGNAPSGQPDWTFAQNAATYTSRTLVVLVRPVAAPLVAFTNRPVHLQVYPRDPVSGGAVVRVDGSLLSAGDTGLTLRVLRDGAAYTNLALALTGAGAEPFALESLILADEARYDFAVDVSRTGFIFNVYNATGVTVALPLVSFTNRPAHLQLYPRAPGATSVLVRVDGSMVETGCTALALTVLRNGLAHTYLAQALSGTGGDPFAFQATIGVELAAYDFQLTATCARRDYVVLRATNVVAGDVLLVSGQSNAESRQFSGSANTNQSVWLRSFGTRTTVGATVQADLTWGLAEGDAVHAAYAVGQWPLRMGRLLVESNQVPLALINHAEGGQAISFFRRNDSNPEDLSTNYGQLLYRVRRAGLSQAVRAILWFQGESDQTDAATHEHGFLRLCEDWRTDFAPVEQIYVCQLKNAACPGPANINVRERQRRLPDQYPGFVVHSTSGLQSHTDNCHYPYELGYRVLGDQLARLLLRDLHGRALPTQIAAPNVGTLWFTDGSGAEVAFRTRNPDDVLSMGHGPQTNFVIEGLPAATVLGVSATGNEVRILFNQDVRAGSGLTFQGQYGGAPFLTNALGVGLLYFYNLPIAPALGVPAPPAGVTLHPIYSNRVDVAWPAVTGAASYVVRRDGVPIGTAGEAWYSDLGVATGAVHAYQVAAGNAAGTSTWSLSVATSTVPHNVFRQVPEAADYDLLYTLHLPDQASYGIGGLVTYDHDASAALTAGIRRVAYHLELQDDPGTATRWSYASMQAFATNPLHLGVPVIARGVSFQQPVTDLNVYASAQAGVTGGLHRESGNIEFWGYNYGPANGSGVPHASGAVYDFGDSNAAPVGTYGSLQVHVFDLDGVGPGTNGQTILAWNRWGQGGWGDVGLGNDTNVARANWGPDYTFAQNAGHWNVRKLSVLVLTDADADGLPDAWERAQFGHLGEGPAGDADLDGIRNGDEYEAGTGAQNGAAWPQVEIRSGGGGTVAFDSSAGRVYTLEVSTGLVAAGWMPVEAGIAGTGGEVTRPASHAAPALLYRIQVSRP